MKIRFFVHCREINEVDEMDDSLTDEELLNEAQRRADEAVDFGFERVG